MLRLLLISLLSVWLAAPAYAVQLTGEEDGTPDHTSNACWAYKFANGNVTANADGTCSIADQTGAGGGDAITVNATAATDANLLDNLYLDFAINAVPAPDDITAKPNYNAAAGDIALLTTELAFAANGFVIEGATADTIEAYVQFGDPATSDKTITFFNATDTVVGRDTTDTLTNKTLAAASNVLDADTAVALAANPADCAANQFATTIAASGALTCEEVDLGSQTGGNYVASVATTAPITGGAAGSEGAALTIALTQGAGTDVTADLEEETHGTEHDGTDGDYVTDSGDTMTGLLTANANLTIGNGATTAGVLTLLEDTDAGSNFASFQVPALAANTVYTLPADDGADATTEVLTSNGSGTLDWITCTTLTGSAGLCDGDDATGAGGGDPILVNTTAVTDANGVDFTDGDVDWTLNAGVSPDTLTATVACTGCVDATDLATDSVAADEIATGAVGTSEAANLDIGDDTNLAAGRSLTLSGDSVEADAELYTDTKCYSVSVPTASDDDKSIWANKTANQFTITELWAESDQTVTFMLQIDDGAPADIDTVDLAPAAGEAEDTSLDGDATMAAGEELDLAITSVANAPTWFRVCWTGQWDD